MSERIREWDSSPLPELDVPAREGWSIGVEKNERGPVSYASNPVGAEGFFLSNRPFEVIDYYVSYKFLALFIKKIKENPGRKIVILDLGGGVESEAIRNVIKHPFLKGKVKVINADLFARNISKEELQEEGIDPEDIVITNEDFATDTSIGDNTVDAVMSFQVLDNISDARLPLVLENVARVLAPGGEALMDEFWRITRGVGFFSTLSVFPGATFGEGGGFLQKIADRHEVLIDSTYRETRLDGTTHVFGGGSGMIRMAKPYDSGRFNFPGMDFRLSFPEIIDAVKDYGVALPGKVQDV